MGEHALDWKESKKNSISPNGNPETKNPECGGVQYWFHSGNIFTSQIAWTAHDNLVKEQACIANREMQALQMVLMGNIHIILQGPSPCGKVVWFCNKKNMKQMTHIKLQDVVNHHHHPPTPPPPPDRCANFVPHPICLMISL